MHIYVLKVLLLLLFLLLLFLFLRVLEGVAWYETGLVISQLVDPLSLSVRKLKILLDGRGISYDGIVEKSELTTLVQVSGNVMEGELLLLEQQDEEESEQSTGFISGGHFYEEVEDKKDSIWLIQVISKGRAPLFERETWKAVVKKVSSFGIRTGTFDCAFDNRFCLQKGWNQPLLMPRGLNQKDNVVMAKYPSTNHKASKVVNWVSSRLASTVRRMDEGKLVKEWLQASQTKIAKPAIRFVLLSETENAEAPLFFSAISLKYSGRVKFGQSYIHKSTKNLLLEDLKLQSRSWSRYLVTTPEGVIKYGTKPGEYLNHRAMDVFLGTLSPQANDFFLLSFLIANMLCVLELAFGRGDVLAQRICRFLWVWIKYNAMLLLMWLVLLTVTQVSILDPAFQFGQKLIRLASQTALASHARCMWIMHGYRGNLFALSFIAFCAVIGCLQSCYGNGDDAENRTTSRQWLHSTAIYYYNMLLRPSPGYTSVLMSSARLEEGDLLINQSMFPLFLLADVSQDYLRDLPTWRYHTRQTTGEKSSECCHACVPSDKECHEQKACGKVGKRGKKHSCRKCPDTRECIPKIKNPILVSDSNKMSNCPSKMVHDKNQQPETIGSLSLDTSNTGLQTQSLAPNLECGPTEKMGQQKPCDKKTAENLKPCLNPHKPTCDCTCQLKSTFDPTMHFDPWPDSMMRSADCSICLEPYIEGATLCGLPCGHAFHHSCITVWLTTKQNHCCPNCRWPAHKNKGSKLSKYKE